MPSFLRIRPLVLFTVYVGDFDETGDEVVCVLSSMVLIPLLGFLLQICFIYLPVESGCGQDACLIRPWWTVTSGSVKLGPNASGYVTELLKGRPSGPAIFSSSQGAWRAVSYLFSPSSLCFLGSLLVQRPLLAVSRPAAPPGEGEVLAEAPDIFSSVSFWLSTLITTPKSFQGVRNLSGTFRGVLFQD